MNLIKINYQKKMERILAEISALETPPRLLLHSCCAPCSSYVIECLCDAFDVTVYYYNPNIYPRAEYEKRKAEQLRLIDAYNQAGRRIGHIDAEYDSSCFEALCAGLEDQPEGGTRCHKCYALRMRATAQRALADGFDYFATTLTVSPHKNAQVLNQIGMALESELRGKSEKGAGYLLSDFKKKEGYKRSIELSKAYDLYRQSYCGCAFSLPALQKPLL